MRMRWLLLWFLVALFGAVGLLGCALGLLAGTAKADAPVIWFGTNSKDLSTAGLITKALKVGTSNQLTISTAGTLSTTGNVSAALVNSTTTVNATTAFVGPMLRLQNSSHNMDFVPPTLAADLVFTWPNSTGTNTQVLQTNGSGALSWVTPTTISPTFLAPGLQLITAMGSTSGLLPAGHRLTSADIPSQLSTSQNSWFPFTSSTTTTDQNGTNAKNLTNGTAAAGCNAGGTAVFTGADFMGTTSNAAAVLNGTSSSLCSTDAYYKLATTDAYAFGAWFKATSWQTGSFQMLIANEYDSANRGYDLQVGSDGYIYFEDGPTGASAATQVSIPYLHGFSAGSWHWLAQSYDPTTKILKAYVDGRAVGSVTITKTAVSANQILRVGARQNTALNFFGGNVADFFFFKASAAPTDDQMRLLYAKIIAHNKAIAPEAQLWSGSWGNSSSTVTVPITTNYVVNKTANTLYADFTDIGVGNYVDYRGVNTAPYGSGQIANSNYDSGKLSSTPATTIAHGMGTQPIAIVYLYETTTNRFTPLQGSNFCEADATNLYCDWTGLSVSASNRLEIVAGGAPLLTSLPIADATTNGVVSTSAQVFSGAKTFTGQIIPSSANGIAGVTDGSAACSGCVGEFKEVTYNGLASGNAATTVWGSPASMSMTAGDWVCGGSISNTTGGISRTSVCLSAVGSGSPPVDCLEGVNFGGVNADGILERTVNGWHVTKTTSWTLSVMAAVTYTSGSIRAHAYCTRLR